MTIKKERNFEITIQGKTIPIISYETEAEINQDQQLINCNLNSNFYVEVLEALSLGDFAKSYWDNYKVYNKKEIENLLKSIAEGIQFEKLSKDLVIGRYVRKYLEGENGYNNLAQRLRMSVYQDGLLYTDYDCNNMQDTRILSVREDLYKLIHDIKYEITSTTNEFLMLELQQAMARLLTIYTTIRELIIKALKKELNNNSTYLKKYRANKDKALKASQRVADAIYDCCIDNNEYLDYVNITIEEFLTSVPKDYLTIAINEYMNAQKEDMFLKLFSIVSKICRKEDGTKYKKPELAQALLNCWFVKKVGIEVFEEFTGIVDEPFDTSRDIEGNLSFASPYEIDEQDYYGDGVDPRISLTSNKF